MPSPINHGSHPFVSTLACLITCLNPSSVLCLFTGSDGPWGHDIWLKLSSLPTRWLWIMTWFSQWLSPKAANSFLSDEILNLGIGHGVVTRGAFLVDPMGGPGGWVQGWPWVARRICGWRIVVGRRALLVDGRDMLMQLGDWVDSGGLVISRGCSKSVFNALASSRNGVTLSGITLPFLCCTFGLLPIAVTGIGHNQVCDSLLLSVENRLLPVVLTCHMFASLFHKGCPTGFGSATPVPPSTRILY